jgi:hypothetical protein
MHSFASKRLKYTELCFFFFLIDTAVGKLLLKTGTIHSKAMLFYIVYLVCAPTFILVRGEKKILLTWLLSNLCVRLLTLP